MNLIATMLNERSQIQKSIGLLHLYLLRNRQVIEVITLATSR